MIPGATSATYRVSKEDIGKVLLVTVTASKSGYAAGSANPSPR